MNRQGTSKPNHYTKAANHLWDDLITKGQKLFGIEFDRNIEKQTDEFELDIKGFKFTCQPYMAYSKNGNGYLYYRCQLLKSPGKMVSFGHELNPDTNSFFIFIPTGDTSCDEQLKEYLSDCCQSTISEDDIPEGLKQAEREFIKKCSDLDIEYDLQCDIPTERGYVITRTDLLPEFKKLDIPNNIMMTFNGADPNSDLPGRRGGVLISFKLKPINDGHWSLVTDKDKETRSPKMSFLQDKDAEKVRQGKTIYQKNKKIEEILDMMEDQYKNPTGKHRRKQSTFPSSFHKSKSFGGITEMIKPQLEPDTNIATTGGANRTSDYSNETSKKTLPKDYKKRKDATDIELLSKYDKVTDYVESVDSIIERTIPRRKLGHVDDNAVRPMELSKVVPDPSNEPNSRIAADLKPPPFQIGMAAIRPQGITTSSGPVSNVATPKTLGGIPFSPNKVIVIKSPKLRRDKYIKDSLPDELEGGEIIHGNS